MRFRLLLWLGCLALLPGLTACSEAPCVLMHSDFEQFEGWMEAPIPLSTEQAHSGRYSYRLPDGADFGPGFVTPLGGLCPELPRRLRVSSWVYLTSGRVRSTMLVTQIMCHGRRPDVWSALAVDQLVPRYRQWEPVEKLIRLPADLDPTDELKVYVWHVEANGEATYFDDIRVEAWP